MGMGTEKWEGLYLAPFDTERINWVLDVFRRLQTLCGVGLVQCLCDQKLSSSLQALYQKQTVSVLYLTSAAYPSSGPTPAAGPSQPRSSQRKRPRRMPGMPAEFPVSYYELLLRLVYGFVF